MQPVLSQRAPPPAGHYSQAIVHNGLIFVAGQLPIDPADPKKPPGTIEQQTEQALHNVAEILKAAGSGLDRLLQVTIYVSDVTLWPAVNTTYARVLGAHRPARAVIPVKELNRGFQIEIQAIAAEGL